MSTNHENPMAEVLPAHIPPEARRPFLQFGLGTLFWITTATAVVCAVVFRMPVEFAIPAIVFICVALPAVLTTVIIYGRSYQRTFCIGAMFPTGSLLLAMTMSPFMLVNPNSMGGFQAYTDFEARMVACAFWVSSLVLGGICVGVRRLVERRPAPAPDLGRIGAGTRTAIAATTEFLKDRDAQ